MVNYIWNHFLPDTEWQWFIFLTYKIILCYVASLHHKIQWVLSPSASQKCFSMTENMKRIEICFLKLWGFFNTLKKQRIWNSPRILDLKASWITTVQRPEVTRKKPEFIPHYRNAPHSVVGLGHKVDIHDLYFLQGLQMQLQILSDLIHPAYAQWQHIT